MKRGPVRPEDALRFLALSNAEPIGSSKREALRKDAAFLAWAANWNWIIGAIGNRGRPKGTRARPKIDDAANFAVMREISAETGEKNRWCLARLAVRSGKIVLNNAKEESIVKRLATGYPEK
jgi:hypothetical protein